MISLREFTESERDEFRRLLAADAQKMRDAYVAAADLARTFDQGVQLRRYAPDADLAGTHKQNVRLAEGTYNHYAAKLNGSRLRRQTWPPLTREG